MYSCAACHQTFASLGNQWTEFGCDHSYCFTCMATMLRNSLTDGPFPPKCCGFHAPLNDTERLRSMLPNDLWAKLDEKLEEVNVEDKTYCSVPTCSSFIKPAHISGNDATCPNCGKVTCVACKAAAHEGACPDSAADPATQQLLHTAATQGWRQCGKCRNMIERVDGCKHMTCTCGHEFCYQCGEDGCACESDEDEDDEEDPRPRCPNCGMLIDFCECNLE